MSTTSLFPEIVQSIEQLQASLITPERKKVLQPLADFIQQRVANKESVNLNFICTHNSRRSHLSQIWSQTIAAYFNLDKVQCYSGGTEATALFPVVAQTLEQQGFKIYTISEGKNPVYAVKYGGNVVPLMAFSKKLDHEFNPSQGFAAIMTCDSAAESCPFVPGAAARIPVMFEDPKKFDNTPLQAQMYMERSNQIATEMYFVFSQIK